MEQHVDTRWVLLERISKVNARERDEKVLVECRSGGRRRRLGCASIILVLAVSGCGDEGGERRESNSSAPAGRLCGDASVFTNTGEALDVIAGGKGGRVGDNGADLADVVEELDATRQSTTRKTGDVCRVYALSGDRTQRLRVFWQLTPDSEGESAPKYTMLDMGEGAGAAWDSAYVTFACDTEKPSDASPDYVSVFAESQNSSIEPRGKAETLKNAYVTIAHAFSLAMAKRMGCRDNAGLLEKPVLIP